VNYSIQGFDIFITSDCVTNYNLSLSVGFLYTELSKSDLPKVSIDKVVCTHYEVRGEVYFMTSLLRLFTGGSRFLRVKKKIFNI
jgi:hypothetical protein